jgi:hypothetical protein
MAEKFYENVPDRSKPKKDSGTVRSTATKLPDRTKVDPDAPSQTVLESLQNERKNQEQDIRNRKEREAYDKGEKTRLKDQGGLKKGGAVKKMAMGGNVPAYAQPYVNAMQPKAPAITPQSAAMAQKFGPSMSVAGAPPVGSPVGPAPAPSAAFTQRFGPPGRIAKGAPKMMGGMKNGGMTASKRGDGIAQKGKTKGRMV